MAVAVRLLVAHSFRQPLRNCFCDYSYEGGLTLAALPVLSRVDVDEIFLSHGFTGVLDIISWLHFPEYSAEGFGVQGSRR